VWLHRLIVVIYIVAYVGSIWGAVRFVNLQYDSLCKGRRELEQQRLMQCALCTKLSDGPLECGPECSANVLELLRNSSAQTQNSTTDGGGTCDDIYAAKNGAICVVVLVMSGLSLMFIVELTDFLAKGQALVNLFWIPVVPVALLPVGIENI
jgi:hypothetical protein